MLVGTSARTLGSDVAATDFGQAIGRELEDFAGVVADELHFDIHFDVVVHVSLLVKVGPTC